jgi:two-component system, cell cycle sensor histidine kinase and response regulator CckA
MTWPTFDQAALLESSMDTTGSVVLALRPDHSICYWNRAAERLYGLSAEQAMGVDYVETFIVPEQRAAIAADIRKVLGGEPTWGFEDDSVVADGTRRTLIWNVRRFENAAGEVCGIVAAGMDITERKEAEAAFRLVWDQSTEGLLLGGGPGILDCNPAALAMLGLTDRSQLVGRHPVEFSPEFQPDGSRSAEKAARMDAHTRTHPEHRFEWVHQRVDGTPVPTAVHVRRTTLRGRLVTVVAWHDLSEHYARAEREHALREQLLQSQKLDALGHLAGGIAHDFNNLLTVLRGSVELALADVPPETPAASELRIAQQTTIRAAALVRQLLAFGRQRASSRAALDVGELVRGAEPLWRRLLPASVALTIDVPSTPLPVWGDPGQLEQVLVNLLVNARDAMPSGGEIRVRALVQHAVEPPMVSLEVSDTGEGIAPSLLERVFDPFFTTKPVGSGTGLGLAVVYGIVSSHEGTVQVESALGRGTTVRVALPLSASDLSGVEAPPLPDLAASGANGSVGGTVLLVDDEPAVRGALSRVLRRAGHDVLEATHGAEALTVWHANASRIAAVVSDVRMPVMSGPEFVRQLWALGSRTPVLLMSGYADAALTRDLPSSVARILGKPFASAELLAAVREVLDAPAGSVRVSASEGLPEEGGSR